MNRRLFFQTIATAAAGLVVARYLPQGEPKPELRAEVLQEMVRKMREHRVKPIRYPDMGEGYMVVVSPELHAALKHAPYFEGVRLIPTTDIYQPISAATMWGARV